MDQQHWAGPIQEVLKTWNVKQVSYVPNAGHAYLIEYCTLDVSPKTVVLTTEEERVAMATEAWLVGERSVLLMQSSGNGNCVNMFSLIRECRIPFLTLITMRGENGEFNPWQKPIGENVETHLKLCGFEVSRISITEESEFIVNQAAGAVFLKNSMGAVLLFQKLIGVKHLNTMTESERSKNYPLRRREVVQNLLYDRRNLLVVAGGLVLLPGK